MALFPGALWRPIPEAADQPPVRITQVIMHVRAGLGDSLYGLWTSEGNGLESHFYVRFDGTVEQYVDTSHSADANYSANLRPDGTGAMSIETEGLEAGVWTAEQLVSLLALARWANVTHGVPMVVCPGPDAPGVGYHVMFGAPGPWTPRAKSCPGPGRVDQFVTTIMPALIEGDDMPLTDADKKLMTEAVRDGTNAAMSAWLPRLVSALSGQANSYFPTASELVPLTRQSIGLLQDIQGTVSTTDPKLVVTELGQAITKGVADAGT